MGPVGAFGTVWAAFLALLLAVPLSLGVALFITHYAPRRLAQGLGYVVDLLAAVPSVVFGLWGILVLAPAVQPIYVWLNTNASWIPLFSGVVSPTGRTILTAAMVLAVMVVPIITAICREIFLQTPRLHEEAALALGATRWEMVRMAVLPFGRSGIVSASMLGLGRALGCGPRQGHEVGSSTNITGHGHHARDLAGGSRQERTDRDEAVVEGSDHLLARGKPLPGERHRGSRVNRCAREADADLSDRGDGSGRCR